MRNNKTAKQKPVLTNPTTLAETMFSFNFPGFGVSQNFMSAYKCYSAAMLEADETRDRVERGDKIIMPPSALHTLTRQHVQYPMLFKVTNRKLSRMTHCGVLEFIAQEGHVYLPRWMMQNLLLGEGDMVQVESVVLPVASHAVFQPQSVDFLDVSNPKAVLEVALRNFTCLTEGDMIVIPYNVLIGNDKKNSVQKTFEMLVVELKPARGVTIIECDMAVDFRAPPGYEEKRVSTTQPAASNTRQTAATSASSSSSGTTLCADDDGEAGASNSLSNARVFVGTGYRVDGKTQTEKQIKEQNDAIRSAAIRNGDAAPQRGVPDYEWKFGQLRFWHNIVVRAQLPAGADTTQNNATNPPNVNDFKPFQTGGISLRDARKNDEKQKANTQP